MISSMQLKPTPWWHRGLAVVAALAVWQLAAVLLNRQLLLVGPITAIRRVFELLPEPGFWAAIGFSFVRIAGGFLLAFIVAVLLAALAYRFPIARTALWPYLAAMKSVPVAAIIILVLIWIGSKQLSVVIAFLVVLPVVYTNLLEGLLATDSKMIEMAKVFRAGPWRRLTYLYLPQVKPFIMSAFGISLGMSWKAGIAAEVIGIPDGSIGERLYEAKVYLSSADLFAWTLVIIAVSLIFEKLVLAAVRAGYRKLEATP
jgi:NitT/TauT family transport system permease protein